MAICPAGHTSAADDYCDVCGLPVGAQTALAPAAVPPVLPLPGALCPHCGTNNAPDALFCEACGYDFTTGTMPRTATPAGSLPSAWGGAPAASTWGAPEAPVAAETAPPADGAEQSTDPGPSTPDATPPTPDATPPTPDPTPVIPANAGIPGRARDDERHDRDDAGRAQGDAGTQGDESSAEPGPVATPPVVTPPSRRPLQPRPTSVDWVAEIWIDPDWYATQGSTDALPSPGLPDVIPLRASSALIGRTSMSRNIHPDIDCDLDNGVSRRHAQITTDGTRWWIEDLESANGTFVGSSAGPLPTDPIGRGRVEFAPDQRIYLGAWTRVVVRAATDDEKQAFNP